LASTFQSFIGSQTVTPVFSREELALTMLWVETVPAAFAAGLRIAIRIGAKAGRDISSMSRFAGGATA
jgi:hypothetical protein